MVAVADTPQAFVVRAARDRIEVIRRASLGLDPDVGHPVLRRADTGVSAHTGHRGRQAHGGRVSVDDRRIRANPARGVSLPLKVKRAHTYLSHEQVELLARTSRQHGTLVRLLSYTGLRWGEAIALRVHDVDTLRRRLGVRENATWVNGKIVVGTPKNHSARVVPFPNFLTLELARSCEGKGQNGLLFGNGVDHLKQPVHGDGWFEVAVTRAKDLDPTFVRLTPHDLRHTAASLAVSAGGNVKAIQRMLGHSAAAMTLDVYADLFDDDLDTLAGALDIARARSSTKQYEDSSPSPPEFHIRSVFTV